MRILIDLPDDDVNLRTAEAKVCGIGRPVLIGDGISKCGEQRMRAA